MLSHLLRATAAFVIVAGATCLIASSADAAWPPVFTGQPAFFSVNGTSPFATCKWHLVTSANPFPDQNYVASVSATSSTNAWIVGSTLDTNVGQTEPIAEHWDGHLWSTVSVPDPGPSAYFNGVVMISATDGWAVGAYYDVISNRFHTLAEHWNGSSWTAVATPDPGPTSQGLSAVAADSSTDVWAVGSYKTLTPGVRATLIEHWNGSSWAVVPSPNVGSLDTVFTSVVANGRQNVWADGASNCPTGNCRTLTERWNGIKWKIVPSPDVNANSNPLNAMTSTAPNDIWALGDYYTGTTFNTLAEHWNGSAWTIVPSANMDLSIIVGSTSVNKNDVWAVGAWQNGSFSQPYSMNWNGTAWSSVAVPSVGSFGSFFQAASKIPGTTTVWGVGYSLNSDGSPHLTLVEKFHC